MVDRYFVRYSDYARLEADIDSYIEASSELSEALKALEPFAREEK